jgi:major intracellular serine protease
MIQVTIRSSIYIRQGPSRDSKQLGVAPASGLVIQMDGKEDGTLWKGINTWYYKINDNGVKQYYWGGGVQEKGTDDQSTLQQLAQKIVLDKTNAAAVVRANWNNSIPQIPETWRQTQGAGVKIAIIDSGVFADHPDIQTAIDVYQDLTSDADKIDYSGHGTHITGLIGARSNANGIIGVAPKANIIVFKAQTGNYNPKTENDQAMADAVNKAIEFGADIINMSMSSANPSSNLAAAITAAVNQNILVVASAGDNLELNLKSMYYPASRTEVISVAAITEGYFVAYPDYSPNLNIVGPDTPYLSTALMPSLYSSLPGCSMTTAFISGVLALALSFKRIQTPGFRYTKTAAMQSLQMYSQNIDQLNYNDKNNFYYNINNAI